MNRRMRLSTLLVCWLLACGGASTPARDEPAPQWQGKEQKLQVWFATGWLEGENLTKRFAELEGCARARKSTTSCDVAHARVTEAGLELDDKVYFETGLATIDTRSDDLLEDVAQLLMAHPEIERIEVAGHADRHGSAEANLMLTRERARAVAARLVNNGVPSSKLRAVGYGSHCPVDAGRGAAANEKNRRVEFVIVRRSGKTVAPDGGACGKAIAAGIVDPVEGEAISSESEPPISACANLNQLATPGREVKLPGHETRPWLATDCFRAWARREMAHYERLACGSPPNGTDTVEAMLTLADRIDRLALSYPPAAPERAAHLQREVQVLEQAVAIGEKYFTDFGAATLLQRTRRRLALLLSTVGQVSAAAALVEEAKELPPHYQLDPMTLVRVYFNLGRFGADREQYMKQALKELKKLDASDPDRGCASHERCTMLAAAWRGLGREGEARAVEAWYATYTQCDNPLWKDQLHDFPAWIRTTGDVQP